MTKEEKDLLLRDLCARLPYEVICEYTSIQPGYELYNEIGVLESMQKDYQSYKFVIDGHLCGFSDFKPYLRPMSSMTEEEKGELKNISAKYIDEWENAKTADEKWELGAKTSYINAEFYNLHHLDWNGLIEKGLAIAVTEENNPYKE